MNTVLSNSRKERCKLIILSLLCESLDYVNYLRQLNAILSNIYDVTIELIEFQKVEELIQFLKRNLNSNCKVYSMINVKDNEFIRL